MFRNENMTEIFEMKVLSFDPTSFMTSSYNLVNNLYESILTLPADKFGIGFKKNIPVIYHHDIP